MEIKDYALFLPTLGVIIALIWNWFQYRNIEKLKSKNEKINLIHRIQFEKEFEIYNDLWGKLVELRNAAASLRPEGDFINHNQSEEDRIKERVTKLQNVFNPCIESFAKNKPFYHESVYKEIEKVIRLTRREARQYQNDDDRTSKYWEDAEQNISEIIDSTDRVCEIIRDRIGLIRIRD